MSLAGSDIVVPQPRCRTVDLDHPGRDDFSYRSTFSTSQSEEIFMGWENCWNVCNNVLTLTQNDLLPHVRLPWRAEFWSLS